MTKFWKVNKFANSNNSKLFVEINKLSGNKQMLSIQRGMFVVIRIKMSCKHQLHKSENPNSLQQR